MVVIMKRTNYFFFLGLVLIFVGFASLTTAENFGFGKTEDIPINYSLIPTVNNSDYFDSYSIASLWTYYTGLGNALWCQLTGCTMAGDINMGGNDINNIDDIVATGTGRFDSGLVDNTNALTIDIVNKYLISGGGTRVDWSGMRLFDGSNNQALDWNNRLLSNVAGVTVLDWIQSFLNDDNGNTILDWSTPGLADFIGNNIQTTGKITQQSDGAKICSGLSEDYCSYFDGKNQIFNSEVASYFNWTNALGYKFDNNIIVPTVETATTTGVLSIQPDADGNGDTDVQYMTGAGVEFFKNADNYVAHSNSANENPYLKFYGASSYGQKYATIGIDDYARLSFGGNARAVNFAPVVASSLGLEISGTATGFVYYNSVAGAPSRYITFGGINSSYNKPTWIMTDYTRRISNFGVQTSGKPEMWFHDGTSNLANLFKMGHNSTNPFFVSQVGDFVFKNSTIIEGNLTITTGLPVTGNNAGTDACADTNGMLCACGSCA